MSLDEQDKKWIDERLESLETKLLTAFHQWASPVEKRQASHKATILAIDAEVELLKEQVTDLKDRIKKLEGNKG